MKKRVISILCVSAMLIAMICGAAYAAESATLIDGDITVAAGWQQVAQINTTNWGGSFDPAVLQEGCNLNLKLSGEELWSAHIVLQADGIWAQMDKDSSTFSTNSDGTRGVSFSYSECVAAYGSDDFSGLGAVIVYVNSASGGTVHSLTCSSGKIDKGYPQGQNLFNNTVTSETTWNADAAVVLTTNWGGEFDPARVIEGGCFYITYEGKAGSMMLALNGPNWVQLSPTSTKSYANGWVSAFTYDDVVAAYGSDFSQLGSVVAFITDYAPTTVTGIYWYGPGDPNNPKTGVMLPFAAAIVGTASVLGLGITIHKRKELN